MKFNRKRIAFSSIVWRIHYFSKVLVHLPNKPSKSLEFGCSREHVHH